MKEQLLERLSMITTCFALYSSMRKDCLDDEDILGYCASEKRLIDNALHDQLCSLFLDYDRSKACPVCESTMVVVSHGWNTLKREHRSEMDSKDFLFAYRTEHLLLSRKGTISPSFFDGSVSFSTTDLVFRTQGSVSRGKKAQRIGYYNLRQALRSLHGYVPELPAHGFDHGRPHLQKAFHEAFVEFYNNRQDYDDLKVSIDSALGQSSFRYLSALLGFLNPYAVQLMNTYGGVSFFRDVAAEDLEKMRSLSDSGMGDLMDFLLGYSIPSKARTRFKSIPLGELAKLKWISDEIGVSSFNHLLLHEDPFVLVFLGHSQNSYDQMLRITEDGSIAVKRLIKLIESYHSRLVDGYRSRPVPSTFSALMWDARDLFTQIRDTLDMAASLGVGLRYRDIASYTQLVEVHDRLAAEHRRRAFVKYSKRFSDQAEKFSHMSFSADGLSITPIATPEELFDEGEAMRHCVYSYRHRVESGSSFIFSTQDDEGKRVGTIELRPKTNTVVQVRAGRNKPVTQDVARFVQDWAKKYSLRLSPHLVL